MAIDGVHGPVRLHIALPLPLFLVLLAGLGSLLGVLCGSLLGELGSRPQRQLGLQGGALLCSGCVAAILLTLLFGVGNDLTGVRSGAFMMLFVAVVGWHWSRGRQLRSQERRLLLGRLSPKG